MSVNPRHRYELLADVITQAVEGGALLPGSRAPSLRRLCKDHGASLSTALQAYQVLEDRGILEARPRSGFYVARRPVTVLNAPAISSPPGTPTRISIGATVQRLLEYAADPRLVPLGCAIPSAELLAGGRLDRFLARAARLKGLHYNIYTTPKGDLQLRQEIARRALRWGQGLSPEDIIVTCGCTEALALALRTVARPGDAIAIESPTYFGLLHILESLSLKALELPTDPAAGIDLAALERTLKQKAVAACLFSSSYNNPLGCTMPDDKKKEVLRLVAKHRTPLIEDDVYGDIYFGADRPKPFAAFDPTGNTIYCSSFSKTIAPGYRIGWLATGRHVQPLLEHKLASTFSGPALPQAALAEFLSCGGYDSHLRRIRRVFVESIARATRAIEQAFPPGTRVSRPAGGYVLWVELPHEIDTRALLDAALARDICFTPGDVFSAGRRYRHCLRLSCGHGWDARMEAGLKTIGELARRARGR
ncbi:MAG TPA: PLP-dependent aminotransferase family protein [Steroidobacteraceae bacterium]|nr:PLP-dependent aminotransferase family protein [Steroidobacteraceae bacterium]